MKGQILPGIWISFSRLHVTTTSEQIQQSLAEAGLELPIDRISVQPSRDGRHATAIISFPRCHMRDLVERALLTERGPKQIMGHALIPFTPPES